MCSGIQKLKARHGVYLVVINQHPASATNSQETLYLLAHFTE
jgi:hypothetical protein